MKSLRFVFLAVILLFSLASVANASPKLSRFSNPPVATKHLPSEQPPVTLGFVLLPPTFTCPSGFNHCGQFAWTASADAATNPTLAYNLYQGTAAGGESVTPVNATPFGAGCSGATCTTIVGIVAPGTYFWTLKATLNGALSAASNETTGTVPPAAPVLQPPQVTLLRLPAKLDERDCL